MKTKQKLKGDFIMFKNSLKWLGSHKGIIVKALVGVAALATGGAIYTYMTDEANTDDEGIPLVKRAYEDREVYEVEDDD